jgi:hypothetical protein
LIREVGKGRTKMEYISRQRGYQMRKWRGATKAHRDPRTRGSTKYSGFCSRGEEIIT